jgi:alanine dehydrogenase
MIAAMVPRSVVVDGAIDQGGCFATSRPTIHADPVYLVDEVVHYCVANMPGGCARTSTMALNNATLPFVLKLAALGLKGAIRDDTHLARGVNVMDGMLTHPAVAKSLGESWQAVRAELFPIP